MFDHLDEMIHPVIYLVGLDEDLFIVDRVFTDCDKAIEYCQQSGERNQSWAWSVRSLGVGADWRDHKIVHQTKLGETCTPTPT